MKITDLYEAKNFEATNGVIIHVNPSILSIPKMVETSAYEALRFVIGQRNIYVADAAKIFHTRMRDSIERWGDSSAGMNYMIGGVLYSEGIIRKSNNPQAVGIDWDGDDRELVIYIGDIEIVFHINWDEDEDDSYETAMKINKKLVSHPWLNRLFRLKSRPARGRMTDIVQNINHHP